MNKLTPVVIQRLSLCVIIILCCYQLIRLILQWTAPPVTSPTPIPPATSITSTAGKTLTPDKIVTAWLQWAPFGRTPQINNGAAEFSAPKTTLPLTLTGIIASNDNQYSLAIISYHQKQSSYSVGDRIADTDAHIKSVYSDRVVIEQPGRITTLRYNDAHLNEGKRPAAENGGLSRNLQQSFIKSPQSILNYLSIAPVWDQQTLLGFRVNPAQDPQLFSQLGFKANDLAIAINGTDLRDMQQSQQIMQQLPQMTQMTVTVERAGQRYNIDVVLSGDAP